MATIQSPDYLDQPGVLIVAEAGSNWKMGSPSRDAQMCHRLIEVAARAGADFIKFQLFRADTIYAKGSGPCSHLVHKGIEQDIGAVFAELEMSYELVPQLADWCEAAGIGLLFSTFSERDFAAVDPYVQIHKIASPELHYP